MTEAKRALLIYTRREIAKALAAAMLIGGGPMASVLAWSHGVSSDGGSTIITTMKLANNTGSTIPAGTFVMFGHPFKKGDISNAWSPTNTSGTAPIFKIGGVIQPYSWGCQTYHRNNLAPFDGATPSLQFACFLLRTTVSIPTTGSTLDIYNGGTAPAGRRALSDVYAQNVLISAQAAWADSSVNLYTNPSLGSGLPNTTPWNGYLKTGEGASFIGSITGTTLTIAGSVTGTIFPLQALQGVGLLPDTRIVKNLTATTWKLSQDYTAHGPVGPEIMKTSNNLSQLVYMTGDAGTMWKIQTHMAQSTGGVPHGQLAVDHYIAALTDGSTNLAGFYYMPHIVQPWWNAWDIAVTNYGGGQAVVPYPNWRAFSASTLPSWSVNGGSPNDLVWPASPHGGWTTQNFSWDGNVTATIRANGYNQGGNANGSGSTNQEIPCFLTNLSGFSGGFQPATDQLYFLSVAGVTTTGSGGITLSYGTAGNPNGNAVQGWSTGTGTFNPCPVALPFYRLAFPTADARYNYFQGTGSTASDPVIQCKFDQTYWRQTKIIPSWNIAAGVSINDPPWDGPQGTGSPPSNLVWFPYGSGNQDCSQTPGTRQSIAPLPGYHASHFFKQSVTSEFLCRMEGLACAGFFLDLRDWNNAGYNFGNLPNMNGPTAGPYTGMSAYQPVNPLVWGGDSTGGGSHGFTIPGWPAGQDAPTNGNYACIGWQQNGTEHAPSPQYYPYLITGEPHMLDIVMEMASQGILGNNNTCVIPNAASPPGPPSNGWYAMTTAGGLEVRNQAHAHNQLELAAGICPRYPPDSSGLWQYLDDVATNNCAYPVATMDPAQQCYGPTGSARQAYITQVSYLYSPIRTDYSPAVIIAGIADWQLNWFYAAMLFAIGLREDLNAVAFMQIMAKRINYKMTHFTNSSLYTYYDMIVTAGANAGGGSNTLWSTALIAANDSNWGTGNTAPSSNGVDGGYFNAAINYYSAASGNRGPGGQVFKMTGVNLTYPSGWVPADGDGLYIEEYQGVNPSLAPGMSYWTPYLFTNTSYNSGTRTAIFDLVPGTVAGATFFPVISGGSRIDPVSSGTLLGSGYASFGKLRTTNVSSAAAPVFNDFSSLGYPAIIYGTANWASYLFPSSDPAWKIFQAVVSDSNARLVAANGPGFPEFQSIPTYLMASV